VGSIIEQRREIEHKTNGERAAKLKKNYSFWEKLKLARGAHLSLLYISLRELWKLMKIYALRVNTFLSRLSPLFLFFSR
jgi:hypothetical protein